MQAVSREMMGGEQKGEQKGEQLSAALAAGAAQSPWVGLEVWGQCLPGACAGLTGRGVDFILCCRFQHFFLFVSQRQV